MFWGMWNRSISRRICTLPKPGAELSLGDLRTRCPLPLPVLGCSAWKNQVVSQWGLMLGKRRS